MTTKAPAPQAEIGYAANATGYSWWAYEGETTPELQWPQSVEVYDAMRRTDSQVASVLRAVTLPVRRTPWRIDPAGARAEVVEFVADDLGLPIVGQNPKVMPRTKDRFSWPEHLRLALLMLSFGFSYFEQTYRVDPDGNRAHLHKLGPRPARTIANVDVARDGGLVSITQWGQIGTQAPQAPIPVGRIVAYVCEREGGNWLGQSLLRTCYKNWLIKDRLLRVQAQTIERNGMGVPLYKAAETETELATGLGMATAWRAGEAAGSAIPFGADLVLRGVEGTLPDALPAIEYHDSQIARAVLAHFLNLGTQTGSWALGTTFADFFTLSLQTLAQQIADTATQHIIEDLVDINFGEDEPAPRLTFDEIGSRQAATAQALKSLADAGFVHPDEVLEESTRQQFGLPPADPDTAFAPPADVSGDGGPQTPQAPEPTSDRPGSVAAAGDVGPKGGAALAAEAVTAKFNPDEPRNPATGEWIHVGGLLDFDALESLYGELIDERSVGDFNVSYYAHGDMTLSVDYDDKRLILADGFDQANTTKLADGLEWAASADPDGDEAIDDTGLVDYDEFTDSGVIVGYDPSGDVRISAPAGNDDEVHEFDVSPEEASGLADALRDMWAANEEHQDGLEGDEVQAKADPFPGVKRETLRRRARRRGIALPRAASRAYIAAALSSHVAAKFNPAEPRDKDGKWSLVGAIKDVLKLLGKIDLNDNEHLLGSGKVDGEFGGFRIAALDRDGNHVFRIGFGTEGYGQASRDDNIRAWDGNPTPSLSSDERVRLDAEVERLDSQIEDAYGNDKLEAELEHKRDAIQERLNAAAEFNQTAEIDEYALDRLATKVNAAMAEAKELDDAVRNDPDNPSLVAPTTFTEGVLPGSQWGDIHYQVYLDEPSYVYDEYGGGGGPTVYIGVLPKDDPTWQDGRDWAGSFLSDEWRKILKLMQTMRAGQQS